MPRPASLSRLRSIRAENRAARVVPGLGAVNIPFARQFGGASLAADPAAGVGFAQYTQGLQASQAALRVLDGQLRVQESRLAGMFVKLRAFTAQAAGAAASTVSTRATLAARLTSRGFGRVASVLPDRSPIRVRPGGITLNRGALGGARVAIAGQAAAGVAHLAADVQDRFHERMKSAFTPQQLQKAATQEAKQVGVDLVAGVTDTAASLVGLKSLVAAGLRLQGASKGAIEGMFQRKALEFNTIADEWLGTGFVENMKKKVRESNRKAVLAIEREMLKAWERIDADLPDTFMVRAHDLELFKAEQHFRNEKLMQAKREGLYDLAWQAAKARVLDGG